MTPRPPTGDHLWVDGDLYVPIASLEDHRAALGMTNRTHRTVRTWVNRGMLAHVKVGSKLYVHYWDAQSLIKSPPSARRIGKRRGA